MIRNQFTDKIAIKSIKVIAPKGVTTVNETQHPVCEMKC